MFEIEYKGGNTVVIATKNTTLVVDPKRSVVGQKDMNTKGDVELATEARFAVNNPDAKLNIEGPGEYEVGDFSLRGVAAQRHLDTEADKKQSTIYQIEVGGVRIALIGNIAPKLVEEQLEAIGVIDIVIIPVGGNDYTLDAVSAAAIVRQIEPKVVIPVHYNDTALTYEVPQDSLETFVKDMGVSVETVAKFKVKSAGSLPDALQVVEVTRS